MIDDDSPGIALPPPLLFITALAAGVLVDGNVLRWRHMMHASQWAGIGVALPGLALIGVALTQFRRHKTRPEPWEPASALVESGPYCLSRNPMYLGMAVASAGTALFFESVAALLLLAGTLLVIDRWVVAREEAYLARRFGEQFSAYRRKVRRWL